LMRNQWTAGSRTYSYASQQQNNRRNFNNSQYPAPRGERNPGQAADNLEIHEEFDIDDSNKKFDKSEFIKEQSTLTSGTDDNNEPNAENVRELAELEDGEVNDESREADAAKFYDKTKSFFDSISCEALEKKMGRLTLSDEKKLNVQTFGVPSAYRNPRQYNGGYNNQHNNYYGNQPRRGGNYYGGYGANAGGANYNNYNNRRYNGPNNYQSGAPQGQNNYYTNNYNTRRGGNQQHSSGGDRRQQNPTVSMEA
jgi:protein LSM14